MKSERNEAGSTRELRLEGVGLVVVGGVLLAAICGAYYLGKWVEGREHPNPILADAGEGPLEHFDGFLHALFSVEEDFFNG